MRAYDRIREAIRSFGAGAYRRQTAPVSSWEQREAEEQSALRRLRESPDFPALQDFFDERLRGLYQEWLSAEDEGKVLVLHARARGYLKCISDLDNAMTADERAKWMQNQIDLMTVDRIRRADIMDRSRRKMAGAAQP